MKSFYFTIKSCFFLLLFVLVQPDISHSQTISVTKDISLENIPNESFETPPSNDWVLSGFAGIAPNNHPSNPNPDTPFGDYFLYLSNSGSASQQLTLAKDGCYRVKIWAAQFDAPGNKMTFRIWIDNKEMAEITPGRIYYEEYQSVAFKLSAGAHVIKIEAIASTQIVLLDNVQLENIPCWSDHATWSTNAVPQMTDDAIVPNDKSVVLDINGEITQLDVEGEFLAANNSPLTFDAERIFIKGDDGIWEWGHEATPYEYDGTITLRGYFAQSQTFPDPGSAFLVAKRRCRLGNR